MASVLSKFVPQSLRRLQGARGDNAVVEEQPVDVKDEKLAGDSDEGSDAASKELATAADPELNPGGLTFEEGVYANIFFVCGD